MKLPVAFLVAMSVIAYSGRARAEWYGAGMIATDGAAWGLGLGGAVGNSPGVAATGLGLAVLGTPLFHLEHKNYGRLAGSYGIRGAALLVGMWAARINRGSNSDGVPILSGGSQLAIAAVLFLCAQAADIALLAHKDELPESSPRLVTWSFAI